MDGISPRAGRGGGAGVAVANVVTTPNEAYVRAFLASMPVRYKELFAGAAVEAHAAASFRRGRSATRVEAWRLEEDGTTAIVVVADDRPGLLSKMSAAFVAHDLDVVAAQAYCRKQEGHLEAVDLFWVHRPPDVIEGKEGLTVESPPKPLGPRDVALLGESLDALVRGKATFERAVRFAGAVRRASAETRVRYETGGPVVVLTVETTDRPGLLLQISRALFDARVQILRSDIATRNGRAVDRFHVTELDGSELRGGRLLAVQTAVLAAVDAAWHKG